MPKVSVIVPNYNHAEYLVQRLEGILNQTFQDIEVILLDDCSNDNSLDVINIYAKQSKVSQCIVNTKNSGSPFKQWQKGIELAKGDFIWIAESDDDASQTFLEDMLTELQNKNADLIFCASTYVDSSNKLIGAAHDDSTSWVKTGKEAIFDYFITKNKIRNTSSVLFRKSCIERIPVVMFSMKYCGDWYFYSTLSLIENVKIAYLNKPLNFFRQHTNNVSTNAEKNGLAIFEGLMVLKLIWKQLHITKHDTGYVFIFNFWYKNILDNYLNRQEIGKHKKAILLLRLWTIDINLFYKVIFTKIHYLFLQYRTSIIF